MSADTKEKSAGLLSAVIFNPSKSVTYRPIPNKQMAEVQIQNNEKTPVIFKWKSTRPGTYKMRPVYGVLNVGEKSTIQLFCKGVKDVPPLNDRYTCVLAASPSANVNAESIWNNHKYQQKLAQGGKMRKVKLMVLYQGINDQEPQNEESEEDEKDKVGKMQKKKTDEKLKSGDTRKRPTIVMFTRKEGDSASGEDDDEKTDDGMRTVKQAGEKFTNTVQENPKNDGKQKIDDGMKTVKPTAEKFTNTVQEKK